MIILVTGGSGSGKSEFAENCCMKLPAVEKRYIATMQAYDEESRARIRKHQNARSGKDFATIEQGTHLEDVSLPKECTALLECMSNLVANEMFAPEGRGEDCNDAILQGIRHLTAEVKHLVIVSNNIFEDGIEYDPGTKAYMRILGEINQEVAVLADQVYEVVCGIPIMIKGSTFGSESLPAINKELWECEVRNNSYGIFCPNINVIEK